MKWRRRGSWRPTFRVGKWSSFLMRKICSKFAQRRFFSCCLFVCFDELNIYTKFPPLLFPSKGMLRQVHRRKFNAARVFHKKIRQSLLKTFSSFVVASLAACCYKWLNIFPSARRWHFSPNWTNLCLRAHDDWSTDFQWTSPGFFFLFSLRDGMPRLIPRCTTHHKL